MKYENLQSPPKNQFSTSIALTFGAAILFAVPLYVFYLWLCNAVLPVEDAHRVKQFTDVLFKAAGAAIGGGGPVALFLRSLMLTQGKIERQ